MPGHLAHRQKCPDGNNRVGGQCRHPTNAAGRFNCTARRTNRPGRIQWANFDARVYNLTPRDPVTGAILQPNAGAIGDARWGGGGHYRIHQSLSKPSQITLAVLKGIHPACKFPDATQQIGCLVEADMCSIGYAGLSANDPTPPHLPFTEGSKNLHSRESTSSTPNEVGTNWPLLLRAAYDPNTSELLSARVVLDYTCNPSPTTYGPGDWEIDPLAQLDCVATATSSEGEPNRAAINSVLDVSDVASCNVAGNFHIRYPLSRALWINASEGFGLPVAPVTGPLAAASFSNISGPEQAFAACMANVPDALVEAHAFLPLPAGVDRLRVCP